MVKNKTNKIRNRNYGDRVTGPWVFGLVLEKIEDIENEEKREKEIISTIESKSGRRNAYQR
jgi:hypothetical protein